MEEIVFKEKKYPIIKLLGRGKGGYSYLVKDGEHFYVLKQIHHEPCSYYEFTNKFQSELDAYKILKNIGINVPKIIDYDEKKEIILKEYIDGDTIDKFVLRNEMKKTFFEQIKKMQEICKANKYNIDYFPLNFVVNNDTLYYIDYEINEYSDKWNFENWGKQYWNDTEEFKNYFSTNTIDIYTENLILRKLRNSDKETLTSMKLNSLSNFIDIDLPFESFLLNYSRNYYFHWGIVLKSTHLLIGNIMVDKSDNDYYLSYNLQKEYIGHGYLKEAFVAIRNYLQSKGVSRLFLKTNNKIYELNNYIANMKD